MEKAFIEQQRTRLVAFRSQVVHDLQQVRENIVESADPLNVSDQEEDAAINTMRQLDMAEGDLFEERIYAIDHALKAIEAGSYGVCERCGRPIAPERLEAKPWASFCITCQAIVGAG